VGDTTLWRYWDFPSRKQDVANVRNNNNQSTYFTTSQQQEQRAADILKELLRRRAALEYRKRKLFSAGRNP
jgi:hypothetical protein